MMRTSMLAMAMTLASAPGMVGTAHATSSDTASRDILPVPVPSFSGTMEPSLRESKPVWAEKVKAPAGAPNILLVLTDDVGFGASSTFGGPIPTPNLDRLAKQGARYNNFHTTAMCSPTRAALLTGRNHHGVGTGALTDIAMGFPGYNGELPATSATIGRILQGNGYSTAWFGKHHNVPGDESGETGPFTRWPTGLGFEEFYGFVGPETDQYRPTLYHGTQPVSLEGRDPTMLLDRDLIDHAIGWLHSQQAATPDKPFFLYYAPGSAHAPHQAPPEWMARFKGKFNDGWDAERARTVARQQEMGIIPKGTAVSPRPQALPAWDSLDADHQRLYGRYMEAYAAMLAYQDHEFGRLLDELERTDTLANTLIIFIEGDNGASGEGGPEGSVNELAKLTGQPDQSFEEQLRNIDKLGGPDSYQVYPAGWAWAMNAPFPLFKQIASHLGGTRNGLVVAWPNHIGQPQQMREQFHHVNDILPTVLEATGIPAPKIVDGTPQHSLDGVSMAYSFTGPTLPGRHAVQYFELLGNRAIYRDGWLAATNPGRMPWQQKSATEPQDFTWSLYNLKSDFAQAKDLAATEPKRLAEMQALFDAEARRNNVYPLRANLDPVESARMRRPETPRLNYVFWGELSLPWAKQPMLARGFTIDCDVTLSNASNGALVATGSNLGGWSFGLDKGIPFAIHAASSAEADQYHITATSPLPAGKQTLTFSFVPDAPRPGAPGLLTIAANGRTIGQGRIDRVGMMPAGPGETFDVGDDRGRPVTDYAGTPHFDGRIERIGITLGMKQ